MIKRLLLFVFVAALAGAQCAYAWIFTKDNITYTTLDDATAAVSGCNSSLVDAVIPATVEYDGTTYTVVSIADKAFNLNSSLATLTAAPTVKSIGTQAFFLAKIKEVKMPGLETLGKEAFYLSSVSKVEFGPQLTEISDGCFNGLKSSTLEIDLSHVTKIGEKAFMRCTMDHVELTGPMTLGKWCFQQAKITTMKLKGTFTMFEGAYVFDNGTVGTLELCDVFFDGMTSGFNPKCTNLRIVSESDAPVQFLASMDQTGATSLYLDVDVSRFSENTSVNFVMSQLEILELGEKVLTVPANWFYNCKNLTSVKIDGNVASVGAMAFAGSTKITTVDCRATEPPVCADNAFDEQVYKSAALNVVTGCAGKYAEAQGWKKFVTINGSLSGIDGIKADADCELHDVYNLQGIKVLDKATIEQMSTLAPGIYIRNGRKLIIE